MASEEQAKLAAKKLGPTLKRRRAFGVDVRKLPRGSGYGVFVFLEELPTHPLPASVAVTTGTKVVHVPVRLVVTEPFKPD